MTLRSLLVVSGTVHVDSNRPRKDKARRAGNVLAALYFKRLRDLTLLHTPWGRLVDPGELTRVATLIARASIDARKHNREHDCLVESTLIWEELVGNRRAAITDWVARKLREDDTDVKETVAHIVESAGAEHANGDQAQHVRAVRSTVSG